jgi:AraC family transcriptional activator of tynA and feaB
MPIAEWTTRAFRAPDRFEAWRNGLNNSHLEWELAPVRELGFHARTRQRTLDGIRIIDCCCDPCTGWRQQPQIRRESEAYFGVLFELRGREALRQDDRESVLEAGDFVMWDSEREMEFRVMDPLHKLTLLIPKRRMKGLLGGAERYAGIVVHGANRGIKGIAAEALRRVARDLPSLDESRANEEIEPLLSLLAATLSVQPAPDAISPAHRDSFRRFCRFIETNLGEPDLTVAAVAAAHSVSERYLHTVFAKHDCSFGQFTRSRRLAQCYRELSQPGCRSTATEIAFRWGFNDVGHFSRTFKAAYARSPKEVRLSSLKQTPIDAQRPEEEALRLSTGAKHA